MKAAMGQRYADFHRAAAPAGRTVLLHIGGSSCITWALRLFTSAGRLR